MVKSRESILASLGSLTLALCGCGQTAVDLVVANDSGTGSDADSDGDADTDSDTDADADTETDTDPPPDIVRAEIMAPDWFDALPIRITSSFYTEEHMPPDGPPDGVGASYDSPDIALAPDPPYVLWTMQPPFLDGQYYLVVTLFVEGGGDDVPVPGVDWVGESDTLLMIGPGTGTVEAGPIDLHLAPPPMWVRFLSRSAGARQL
jgi:hypothetical protein